MRAVVIPKKYIAYIFDLFLILCLSCVNVNSQKNDDIKISRKTCLLKPDEGPCRSNIPMYYFKPSTEECSRFLWGGCQGNGNRFDTRESCLDECISKDSSNPGRPRWCFLNFDYGYCFGGVMRYYYDPLWQVCKQRIYSGCGGNKNNFYSFEECERVCRFNNIAKSRDTDSNMGISQQNNLTESGKPIQLNKLVRKNDLT